MSSNIPPPPPFGTEALRMPDELRGPVMQHLADLRAYYVNQLNWGARVGFGDRPAMIVIDLALAWTDSKQPPMGSNVDSLVEATARLLAASRRAGIPIIFTTSRFDPAKPPSPHDDKMGGPSFVSDNAPFALDPRLGRGPNETVIEKPYASAFKGTNLHEILCAQSIDTLIVTGVSTSHCVYATCRDATDSVRVIVPRSAVGERCEIMHEVNLLDMEIDLADVVDEEEVIEYLDQISARQ